MMILCSTSGFVSVILNQTGCLLNGSLSSSRDEKMNKDYSDTGEESGNSPIVKYGFFTARVVTGGGRFTVGSDPSFLKKMYRRRAIRT
jgi:hypothetical protein